MPNELKDALPILISLIAVIVAAVSAIINWMRAPGDIGEKMTKIADMNAEKRLSLEKRILELEEEVDRINRNKRYAVTVVFMSNEEEKADTVEKVEVKRLDVDMEKT